MLSFRVTTIISIEYSQPSILLTVLYIFPSLKYAVIQFCQRTSFQRISEDQSPWNKLLIKAAYCQSGINYIEMRAATWSSYFFVEKFFRTPSCLEQLHFSNNYFFVTNIFSDQLLLEDK